MVTVEGLACHLKFASGRYCVPRKLKRVSAVSNDEHVVLMDSLVVNVYHPSTMLFTCDSISRLE